MLSAFDPPVFLSFSKSPICHKGKGLGIQFKRATFSKILWILYLFAYKCCKLDLFVFFIGTIFFLGLNLILNLALFDTGIEDWVEVYVFKTVTVQSALSILRSLQV